MDTLTYDRMINAATELSCGCSRVEEVLHTAKGTDHAPARVACLLAAELLLDGLRRDLDTLQSMIGGERHELEKKTVGWAATLAAAVMVHEEHEEKTR